MLGTIQQPYIIKIPPRGNITIPKELRDKAGLQEGDYAELSFDNGAVTMKPRYFYPLREYTNKDIERFVEQDKLDDELQDLAEKAQEVWQK